MRRTWFAVFAMVMPLLGPANAFAADSTRGSQPHPAVARIIVPERSATSYGTGTLVDIRDQYGLVITNWHVVRDGSGPPEVVFPNGFRSQARPLKLDSHWDLAALVIWRPPIEPVTISHEPPRPGDLLTICGYGQGNYRAVTGRCTQYFAPRVDYPQELVELDVEARQGDSGGPIFNERGELAGVLFGAGRGTTMGSYGGRVHSFLASLAPDIGNSEPERIVRLLPPEPVSPSAIEVSGRPAGPAVAARSDEAAERDHLFEPRGGPAGGEPQYVARRGNREEEAPRAAASPWSAAGRREREPVAGRLAAEEELAFVPPATSAPVASVAASSPPAEPLSWNDVAGRTWLSQLTTLLAIVGAIAVIMQLSRLARP